jgi:hypothetical protein
MAPFSFHARASFRLSVSRLVLLSGLSMATLCTAGAQTAVPLSSEIGPGAATLDRATGVPALTTTINDRNAVAGTVDGSPASVPATLPQQPQSRLNLRTGPAGTRIDARPVAATPALDTAPGIRVGTFILRPSVTQRIVGEANRSGSSRDDRSFAETEANLELLSDWSLHELSLRANGIYQRNLSGGAATEPEAQIDANLRLDLFADTIVDLRAGYDFERESATDPNALQAAAVQAGVDTFRAGIGVGRELGIIRAAFDLDAERSEFGSAQLADGTRLSLADRDETTVRAAARLGYAISPALIPFLEASIARTEFDQQRDSFGFERSAWTYGIRPGVAFDFGEKLSGELAAGYALRTLDDGRLSDLDGLSIDGIVNWSPQRGTNVTLAVFTDIESSTRADVSGTFAYGVRAGLARELRHHLVARLGAAATLRDFSNAGLPDQTVYAANVGLTWSVNRYLDMVADAGFERTTQGASDFDTARVGLGLTLRR